MKQIMRAWLCGLCITLIHAQTTSDTQQALKELAETLQISRPLDTAPVLIQCQFECIEISHEEMTDLLFLRNQSFADATKLRKELHEMVAQKKAKVVDTTMIVCKSGQRATAESLAELISPGGFDEPSLPTTISPSGDTNPADGKKQSALREPPIPTWFDNRYTGGTLEVEPTLSNDDKVIDLRFNWEIVDHEGEKVWMNYQDSLQNTHKIEMPKFFVKRVATSFSCAPSSYTLVATTDPQNEKGIRDPSRKWLIFAKCETQSVR